MRDQLRRLENFDTAFHSIGEREREGRKKKEKERKRKKREKMIEPG